MFFHEIQLAEMICACVTKRVIIFKQTYTISSVSQQGLICSFLLAANVSSQHVLSVNLKYMKYMLPITYGLLVLLVNSMFVYSTKNCFQLLVEEVPVSHVGLEQISTELN